MLVLSRKVGEQIVIGDNITIVVNRVAGSRVSIGIEAPHDVKIIRGELEAFVDEFRDAGVKPADPPILAHPACDPPTADSLPFQPR